MATANLNNDPYEVITENDSVVIVENLQSVRGGRTLDVTGFTPKLIKAGHMVIRQTSNGELKPMPVNSANDAYAALPAGHEYAYVNLATIRTDKAFAGLLEIGKVNPAAAPYPMDSILSAVKTALPLIIFRED